MEIVLTDNIMDGLDRLRDMMERGRTGAEDVAQAIITGVILAGLPWTADCTTDIVDELIRRLRTDDKS